MLTTAQLRGSLPSENADWILESALNDADYQLIREFWEASNAPSPVAIDPVDELQFTSTVIQICIQNHGVSDAALVAAQNRVFLTMLMVGDVPADKAAEYLMVERGDNIELGDPGQEDERQFRSTVRAIQRLWEMESIARADSTLDEFAEAEYVAEVADVLEFDYGMEDAFQLLARQRNFMTGAQNDEEVTVDMVVEFVLQQVPHHQR